MRIFLAISLLLGSFHNLISQNFNIARHRGIDNAGSLVTVNSNSYYWETYEIGCCSKDMRINAVDYTGDTLWSKRIFMNTQQEPVKLIRTHDQQLVFVFRANGCHTGPYTYYFTKLDLMGNIVFQHTVTVIRDIVEYTDSSFYAVSSTDLLHYSKEGQLISQISTGVTHISSISVLNNGNFLINGQLNSVLKNIEITAGNVILNHKNTTSSVIKFIQAHNGIIIGRTSTGTLEKYTADLTLTAVSFPSVADFTLRNDSVFSVGYNASSHSLFYRITDLNFNMLYQVSPGYKNVFPVGVSLNNQNRICMLTQGGNALNNPMSFTGLYQFDIAGSPISRSDIGIIGYKVKGTSFQRNGNFNQYFGTANLDVTVKNFGTDTVKNFYVNYYAQHAWCLLLFHEHYVNTILPGDSLKVSTGNFDIHPYFVSGNDTLSEPVNLNICVFTTVPNCSNDINPDNDIYCESIPFVLTGISENELSASDIDIYPNPFSADFTIRSTANIQGFTLYNASGSTVKSALINSTQTTIDQSNLSSGIYFLKLETTQGFVMKKIIKQ